MIAFDNAIDKCQQNYEKTTNNLITCFVHVTVCAGLVSCKSNGTLNSAGSSSEGLDF